MTSNITNRQLFFLLFVTIFPSADLANLMMNTTGRSSWIPIIIMSIICGTAAIVISKLNIMFTNKVLFDYGQIIVGKFITYIIVIFYIFQFFTISIYQNINLLNIIKSNILPNTPIPTMLIFGTIVFLYIANKGITNFARLQEIYALLFIIVTIFLCILMLSNGMKENMLPFFNKNETKNLMSSMKYLIIPFGGIEILVITAFTVNNKKAPVIAFFTLLIIGLLYIFIVESTIMILGVNNAKVLKDAYAEGIMIINVPIIERADILLVTFNMSSFFSTIIISLLGVLELACKLFKTVKRYIISMVIAVIFFLLCNFAIQIKNLDEIFMSTAVYTEIIASFFIPFFLFVIAKFRKLGVNYVK